MAIDVNAVIDAIASPAMALGVFSSVQKHEPKSQPNDPLHYAVYIAGMSPIPARSGLAVTSVRLEVTGRIYSSFIQEPQDLIDPDLASATSLLMGTYSGNFDLDIVNHNIDLLGAHGSGLSARAGYLSIGNKIYRVMDIVIPVIINNAWDQAA